MRKINSGPGMPSRHRLIEHIRWLRHGRNPLFGHVFKSITDPADGNHERRAEGVVLYFLSNVADMDVHRLWNTATVAFSSMREEIFAGEHVLRAPGKRIENVKLHFGEFNKFAVFPDAPFTLIAG